MSQISRAIDYYPAAYDGNPLNLLFLDESHPIRSAAAFLRELDDLSLIDERREYLLGTDPIWPFPAFRLAGRPGARALSTRLFERFEQARSLLLTQAQIGDELRRAAGIARPDVMALMVVDGLSYYDLPDSSDIRPCLVPGVTITQFGFREVIGKPSVSQKAFALGYKQQLGFSFFSLDGDALANDLYSLFAASQVVQVGEFAECLDRIDSANLSRGYIQITAPGLDRLCHHHHDRPPVDRYVEEIMVRFDRLTEALGQGGRRYLACLTSDHGILWRDQLGDAEVVSVTRPDDALHPRYLRGSVMRDYAIPVSSGGQWYSLLRAPYLTRPLKRTEWGVHGGISAWESIVPLIIRSG